MITPILSYGALAVRHLKMAHERVHIFATLLCSHIFSENKASVLSIGLYLKWRKKAAPPLCDDLWQVVLKKATFKDSIETTHYLGALRLVSKKFNSYLDNLKVHYLNSGAIIISDCPGLKNKQEAFKYLIQHGKRFRYLDMTGYGPLTFDEIKNICSLCPELETFLIENSCLIKSFIKQIERLKKVNYLTIYSDNYYEKKLNISFRFLKSLCLANLCVRHISFKHMPYLKKLDLRNIYELAALPKFSKTATLKKLSLICCGDITNLSALENLTALEELKISGCYRITQVSLTKLKELKKLTLFLCPRLLKIKGIEKLPQLKNLMISKCHSELMIRALPQGVVHVDCETKQHRDEAFLGLLFLVFFSSFFNFAR